MIRDLRGDERYCGYIKDKLSPTKVSELENDKGYLTGLVTEDDTTETVYSIGIDNGIIYLEEV
jgi:hypothetical protein